MAERNPLDDKAAFGVFPQLKRNRAKQDREAAKNVPVDLARGFASGVLGAPGDIESFLRIPYDYFRAPTMSELVTGEKTSKTYLPTSEDIEKKIPFKSDTPVSRAATGLGTLAGGFYTGPGSPLRVIGALPSAIRHGAEEFVKASAAGAPNVVKREGGNWIQNTVDNSIRGLKRPNAPQVDDIDWLQKHRAEKLAKGEDVGLVDEAIRSASVNTAMDKWIESKIGRYVKSEMGTPSDPIRLLIEKREAEIAEKFMKDQARANRMADRAAEEADPRRKANLTRQAQRMLDDAVAQRDLAMEHTSHLPRGFQNVDANEFSDDVLKSVRKAEGFPEQGMGTTPSSRAWESKADMSIYPINVGEIQSYPANKLSRQKAIEEYNAYEDKLDQDVIKYLKSKGIEGQYMAGLMKMSGEEKAALVGDTKLKELLDAIPPYSTREPIYEAAGKESYIGKLDPKSSVYSGDISGLHFDHIVDVLKQDVASGRITPEQLNKITMEQAVRRTADYDLERSVAMREAKIKQQEGFPVHKEYPEEGYKWIELTKPKITVDTPLPEGFRWLEPKGGYERLEGPSLLDPQRTRTYLGDTKEQALKVAEERSMLGSEQLKMLEDALKYEGDTMGHCVGGYCPDVAEGRSRIYSLRDSKGEPHVTIEVQPFRGQLRQEDLLPYKDAALEEAKRLPTGYTDADVRDIEIRMARENMPPNIVQIKGKQNLRPIEKYDPYTQDFIRSGNWSNIIGDFQNTGLYRADPYELGMTLPKAPDLQDLPLNRGELLVRAKEAGLFPEGQKYLTRNEWEDILRKQYLAENPPKPDVPPEGMKRGGVAISHNPDAMMLAVNNKKLAKGGTVADYNTIPDMNDGGTINQGPAFNKGGKVKISNNKDAMWLATQEQKLKGGGNPHSGADLLKDVLKESASNVESIARGAISAVPGVFGDLEKLGRMGINWSFGPGGIKVGEDTILPTSADLRSYVGRLTAPTKQAEGFEELGSAANFRGQDLALRLAGKGAKAIPKAAGEELNKALMGESSIFPEGLVPQPLYAAPKGKGKASETPINRVLTPEEKLVLEKWGQKQAQEAERAKKVEKMAKESASKSPEESVKKAKASTGKRTATPPDFYRKMAEEQGDEAVLRAARAGKHLKPDTSGGYVGAPRTVDSPQALGKMRRDLDQDFIDSVDAVRLADPERLGTWYDRAKSGMAQMTEPYQLPRTLEQHGVYSAGVAPESELTFALKHLNSRVYGEPKMAYRGAGMRTLDRAVAADEPAEMGFKIGEYADKNDPRLPNTGLFGVNDFRRAQGMGYTDPQGNPWKAGVSDTMHPFMDMETALQVDRANKAQTGGRSDWYGPHIQELPWVYGKGQDLYSRGSSKTGRYGGDPLEGIKLALQDANKTAIDYAYKHAGSATHEAIPGPNTGHVPSILNAPLEERIAYTNTGRWDRPVPEAALNEFPEVGAGNRDVIYSALGHRQLPTLDASGAFLPEGATVYDMQPVKIARPLLDFPTGGEGLIAPETKQLMDFSERFRALNDAQEAFGYNLPNTMGDVTGKNALMLDTRRLNPNRNLDPATGVQPSTEQMGALTAALEDTGYGIAPTSRGATIFPFNPNATTKDINKLLKSKRKDLEGIYPSDIETSLNSSGFGPGVGKYTPKGFTATEPFSGEATKGLLKEASYLPQSAVQNLSESEFVRQAIKEKMRRDEALPNARADIQNTRRFFAEADWAKAVDLIRKGMSPTAALAALGYSASSMAGEADR